MRLFTHPHKTTQLSRDKFAPLGRAWPKSHAQTVDDFKENLKYFGFELTRLRDSNAWLEDTDIYLRDAHSHFFLLTTALENLVTDATAKHFTDILNGILQHVDCLCCRVVTTFEDSEAYVFRQQEAALSAARELEPYCKEEDTKNQMMIKQTVARAMTHIREFGPEIKDKKSAQEQDEELKRVKKEALDLYRQCD